LPACRRRSNIEQLEFDGLLSRACSQWNMRPCSNGYSRCSAASRTGYAARRHVEPFPPGSARAASAAWDPYNVTEDADLGVRSGALRLPLWTCCRQATDEDAPDSVDVWLRQRIALDEGLDENLAGAYAPAIASMRGRLVSASATMLCSSHGRNRYVGAARIPFMSRDGGLVLRWNLFESGRRLSTIGATLFVLDVASMLSPAMGRISPFVIGRQLGTHARRAMASGCSIAVHACLLDDAVDRRLAWPAPTVDRAASLGKDPAQTAQAGCAGGPQGKDVPASGGQEARVLLRSPLDLRRRRHRHRVPCRGWWRMRRITASRARFLSLERTIVQGAALVWVREIIVLRASVYLSHSFMPATSMGENFQFLSGEWRRS
jgi:hypothetical protein